LFSSHNVMMIEFGYLEHYCCTLMNQELDIIIVAILFK
jgi:hypothetical protein